MAILLNFHNHYNNVSLPKNSSVTLSKHSTLLKSPFLIMLLISFSFNHAIIFCTNPHALVLINQYSTGPFVSHSAHGKTQLQETSLNWQINFLLSKPGPFIIFVATASMTLTASFRFFCRQNLNFFTAKIFQFLPQNLNFLS